MNKIQDKVIEPMKRSAINSHIEKAIDFFAKHKYPLPGYAYWSPEEWAKKGPECDEIRDLGLGWDVTDFGCGDFVNTGRIIFTLRNGSTRDKRYAKPYAQKIMCLLEGQKSPAHYHKAKMEDIINNNGGNILVTLWKCGSDESFSDEPLEASVSGQRVRIRAGEHIRLKPGESVNIPPYTIHQFWAEEGHGSVLSMEVSTICDDYTDNFFLDDDEMNRFPGTTEDEPVRYVRGSELKNMEFNLAK